MNANFKKISLWVIYAAFLVSLLATLWLDNRFFFPFITSKIILFRTAVEIMLLFYLVLNIVSAEYRPRITALTIFVAAFIIVAAVSSYFGPNFYQSFWGDIERGEGLLLWLHLLAFLFILSGVVRTKQAWLALLDVSIGVAILMALFGAGQALGVKNLLATSGDRVDATLGNAAFFGAYLLLHLSFALYLFTERRGGLKIYYALAAFLFAILIPATQTRGAVIGLVIGIIFAAILHAIARRDNRGVRRTSAGIILAVVLLSGGLYLARNQPWVKNIPALQRVLSISLSERTAETRLATWAAAWRGWLERPILGWGLENFNIVFNKDFPPIIYEDAGSQVWFDRAHNVIFDRGVTTGFVGLALFLALLFYPLYYLLRYRLREHEHRWAAVIFSSLLVAYFIQDLFIFESAATYMILFLTLGFLGFAFLPELRWRLPLPRPVWIGLAIIYGALLAPIVWNANLYPAKVNAVAAAAIRTKIEDEDFFQIAEKHKKYLEVGKYTYGLPEYRLQFIDFVGQQLAPVGEVVPRVKPILEYTDEQIEKQLQEQPDDAKNWLLAMRHYNYTYLSLPDKQYERLEKALSYFPRLRELSPTRPHVYQEAGYSNQYLFRSARADGKQEVMDRAFLDAEKYFQKTIDLQPRVYESYGNLIKFYLEAGATEKIKPLVAGMEANHVNFRTHAKLAGFLNEAKLRQNYFWASYFAEALATLEPDIAKAFIDWALSEAYLGHREKAIEIAEKIKAFGGSYVEEAEIFIANVRSGFYEKQISR
ncbi:MAG: O-antigen ligase family protein [Candidatus Doudnabacteria bacterium]|nr:O-antigen ligase family protein [Candidatus Doudnabacteria bacterium]